MKKHCTGVDYVGFLCNESNGKYPIYFDDGKLSVTLFGLVKLPNCVLPKCDVVVCCH